MQKIYVLGLILCTPLISRAHDDEHMVTAWYQEPMVIVSIVVGLLALAAISYGLVTKQKNLLTVSAIALVVVGITGMVSLNQNSFTYEPELMVANFGAGQSVTLYKNPNCGCCTGHAKALEDAGFVVTIEETDNLDVVKQSYNIPPGGESCHTSVIGDYVVEGHVPLEAIEKLINEQPEIAGIGLPGMPIGTPGMPGRKVAPFEVYQLSEEGEMLSYVNI